MNAIIAYRAMLDHEILGRAIRTQERLGIESEVDRLTGRVTAKHYVRTHAPSANRQPPTPAIGTPVPTPEQIADQKVELRAAHLARKLRDQSHHKDYEPQIKEISLQGLRHDTLYEQW